MMNQFLLPAARNARLRRWGRRMVRLPLAGGIFRRALERVWPRNERVWTRIPFGPAKGIWLKVNPYMEPTLMRGEPEWRVQEIIWESLKQGDCFYDVGAHIGYYSFLAGRRVGAEGWIVSFEPDPDNIAVFRENLARNRFPPILLVPAAAWIGEGVVAFRRGADLHSRMSGKVAGRVPAWERGPEILAVPACSLDHFSRLHRPPDFVKIDVEGGELEVLRGARETLFHHGPAVLIEIHRREHIPSMREFFAGLDYSARLIGVMDGREGGYKARYLARPRGRRRAEPFRRRKYAVLRGPLGTGSLSPGLGMAGNPISHSFSHAEK